MSLDPLATSNSLLQRLKDASDKRCIVKKKASEIAVIKNPAKIVEEIQALGRRLLQSDESFLKNKKFQEFGNLLLHYFSTTEANSKVLIDNFANCYAAIVPIKNALHIEACTCLPFAQQLNYRIDFLQKINDLGIEYQELFSDILSSMPDIIHKISLDKERNVFSIEIEKLFTLFQDKWEIEQSQDFDVAIFTVFNGCTLQDGMLEIPFDCVLEKTEVVQLLLSPNLEVRLIGQLFLLCLLNKSEIENLQFKFTSAEDILSALDHTPNTDEYNHLNQYKVFEDFTPLLYKLLEKRDSYIEQNKPLKHLLLSASDSKEILDSMGKEYHEVNILLYDLLIETQKIFMMALSKDTSKSLIKYEKESCDPKVIGIRQLTSDYYKVKFNFTNHFFCESSLDFQMFLQALSINSILQKSISSETNVEIFSNNSKAKKSKNKKHAPKKSPQQMKKLPAVAHEEHLATTALQQEPTQVVEKERISPDSVTFCAQTENIMSPILSPPEEFDDTDFVEYIGKKAFNQKKLQEIRSYTGEILDNYLRNSLSKTASIISYYTIDPRVLVWFDSVEKGLTHRAEELFDGRISHEDMILRHRFPQEILLLALNKNYAKRVKFSSAKNETTYESIVLIDDKKFVLEATIDEKKVLYHLYARPVKNFAEYISKNISITSGPNRSEECQRISNIFNSSLINFSADGNAFFEFEGKNYEFFRIHK